MWLHQILLEIRWPLAEDQDSHDDDGLYHHVIWLVLIWVIRERKPYRWFLCYHLPNLASCNYVFPVSGSGTLALDQVSFPVSQALTRCCGCVGCKYCKGMLKHKQNISPIKCQSAICFLKLRKMSQRPGLYAQLFCWHSRWPWGGNHLTLSCPVTLGVIANTSLRFVDSLRISDKWLYGVAQSSSAFSLSTCPCGHMGPPGKKC